MKRWFTITNKGADKPQEVILYGLIGRGWDGASGVDAKAFAEEWNKIPTNKDIDLRFHSPGGSVFDGLLIYNLVAMRRERVTAYIDGLAASIASVIAMAAGKIVMPKTARMMIHDAEGLSMGNSDAMREMAELLDRESDRIADIYAAKTGKSRGKMRDLMKATTWMDGAEAEAAGFADEVTDLDPKNCTDFDLSMFRCVPEALKGPGKTAAQNSGANKGEEKVNKLAILALLLSHGVNLENTADDATILAALGKLVTDGKVTAQEQTRLVTPPAPPVPVPAPAPAPAPQNVVSLERFNQLQASFNAEREMRITARFDSLVASNPNIDRAVWLPLCLQNEALINNLEGLPGRIIDPSRPSVLNMGNPLVENYRKMKPGHARHAFRIENEAAMLKIANAINPAGYEYASRLFGPQNANTLSATLVTDYLADGLIVVANNKLAPLGLFSRNFGTDPLKPRATVDVAKATAGATTLTNGTNFEAGDSTLGVVQVPVSQITQPFHLTNDQLNKGFQLGQLAAINADVFSNALSDIWTALVIAGNYGAAQTIGLSTAFAPDDLPAIFATAKNYRLRNLLLDGAYLGYLFPGVIASFSAGTGIQQNANNTLFPGVFGFDALAMQNRWTGATANSVGFVCGPDAIAVGAGLPIGQPQGEFISMQVVSIDGLGTNVTQLGLSVLVLVWYSRATRTIWCSFDVMFGAISGDTTQGKGLVSA
jgi:ATP-dependent protease ClpP protease subunit